MKHLVVAIKSTQGRSEKYAPLNFNNLTRLHEALLYVVCAKGIDSLKFSCWEKADNSKRTIHDLNQKYNSQLHFKFNNLKNLTLKLETWQLNTDLRRPHLLLDKNFPRFSRQMFFQQVQPLKRQSLHLLQLDDVGKLAISKITF